MRAFAVAILLALTILPKTGWVVRNHIDYLRGGYKPFGADLGFKSHGLAPRWPFEKGVLDDPLARTILDHSGDTAEDRLNRIQDLLDDPTSRAKLRPIVLRNSFTSILVSHMDDPKELRMKRIAARLLRLAVEGEKAEPDNAFYPACAWPLYAVLGQPQEADAALSRAARCPRYDDGRSRESQIVESAIEGQFGYRGSLIREQARGEVLLPQFSALRRMAKKIADSTPLTDPRRKEIIRLGEMLIRSGESLNDVGAGRGLIYLAMGSEEVFPHRIDTAVMARAKSFAAANPDFDPYEAANLVAKTEFDFASSFDDFQAVFDSPLTPLGGATLMILILSLALSIPKLGAVSETFEARANRALWAWLAVIPAALVEQRNSPPGLYLVLLVAIVGAVVLNRFEWGRRPAIILGGITAASTMIGAIPPGTSCTVWAVAPLLWLSALVLPAAWRLWARSAILALAVYSIVGRFDRPFDPILLLIGSVTFVFATRTTLPVLRDRAWLPAGLAVLYLGLVGAELMHDAQIGEVVRRFDDMADRFRMERGIH